MRRADKKWIEMNGKLRMTELFAGIGAQKAAMDMAKIECETIVCEIDDKAYRSYCAIHGDTPCLTAIFKGMFIDGTWEKETTKQVKLTEE